jgi:hypothetical protein
MATTAAFGTYTQTPVLTAYYAADPAQSTATVPASGTVGVATSITVQAVDTNGDNMTIGGDTVVVSITGANTATPTVTDNADGTYSASYTPANKGTDSVAITLNGTAISGSPYTSTVSGAVDLAAPTATIVTRAYAPAVAAGAAVTVPVATIIMQAYAPTIPVGSGDFLAALYARMVGHSGIASCVGSRVYPVAAPQEARLPLVRYRLITGSPTNVFGADTQPSRALVQIGVAARTYAQAQTVARQVRYALKRWSGTEEGVLVQQAFLVRQVDGLWDPDLEAYTVEQDYEVWHEGWST